MKKQTKSKKAAKSRKAPKIDAAVPATWPESKPRKERARDPRLPAAGTTLTRIYKGSEHRVTVLEDGFRYGGKEFRSLTAIARFATGYPAISGPAWFALTEPKVATPKATSKAPTKARAPKAKRAARDPKPAAAPDATPDAALAPTSAEMGA